MAHGCSREGGGEPSWVKEGADGELAMATTDDFRRAEPPCDEAPMALKTGLDGDAESSAKSSSMSNGSSESSRNGRSEGLMFGESRGESRGPREGEGPGERREGLGLGELLLLMCGRHFLAPPVGRPTSSSAIQFACLIIRSCTSSPDREMGDLAPCRSCTKAARAVMRSGGKSSSSRPSSTVSIDEARKYMHARARSIAS